LRAAPGLRTVWFEAVPPLALFLSFLPGQHLEEEEAIVRGEASLVKAEDLEVLARKSLVTDSARLKVAISRRVREIVARLEDPSVPVRSAAQALAPILRLVYG
jgi:hypothetical protein